MGALSDPTGLLAVDLAVSASARWGPLWPLSLEHPFQSPPILVMLAAFVVVVTVAAYRALAGHDNQPPTPPHSAHAEDELGASRPRSGAAPLNTPPFDDASRQDSPGGLGERLLQLERDIRDTKSQLFETKAQVEQLHRWRGELEGRLGQLTLGSQQQKPSTIDSGKGSQPGESNATGHQGSQGLPGPRPLEALPAVSRPAPTADLEAIPGPRAPLAAPMPAPATEAGRARAYAMDLEDTITAVRERLASMPGYQQSALPGKVEDALRAVRKLAEDVGAASDSSHNAPGRPDSRLSVRMKGVAMHVPDIVDCIDQRFDPGKSDPGVQALIARLCRAAGLEPLTTKPGDRYDDREHNAVGVIGVAVSSSLNHRIGRVIERGFRYTDGGQIARKTKVDLQS